jgi:hypothetical protein
MSTVPDSDRFRSYLRLSAEVNGGAAGASVNSLENGFRDMVAMFRAIGAPYALFGAFAVAAYVPERRSTLDIDVVAARTVSKAILDNAPAFGFREDRQGQQDLPVLRFRHRDGALLDVILSPEGFADLQAVETVELPGIGPVPVASAVDLAFSKLRTQMKQWARAPEKRLTDRADLLALLKSNPDLPNDLLARLLKQPHAGRPAGQRQDDMLATFRQVCREGGFEAPRGAGTGSSLTVVAVVVAILVGLLAILAGLGVVWIVQHM